MNKVSQESIKQLLEYEDNTTLSIYLPTHRFPTSEHINEDQIRCKNLLRAGRDELEGRGTDEASIEQMVGDLERTFYDNEFWQHTTEGLAVFCSPAGTRYFHLPIECDEYISVGDAYDITPLLLAASLDMPYYLLALAVHNPVLYKGDMYGVERIDIELPESPEQALGIDELFSNSQTIRAGGYGTGNPGTKSHGQGDSRQAGQEERLKFFRMIDEAIRSSGLDITLPLLLAGSGDDVSSFKESSRLKTIITPSLSGNYTEVAAHDIHARAWPIINQEFCEKKRQSILEKINNLLGTGKASVDPADILIAAKEGRVDTVVIGSLVMTRDTISDDEDEKMKLTLAEDYAGQDITKIGRHVFNHGGEVDGDLRENISQNAHLAAVYRY